MREIKTSGMGTTKSSLGQNPILHLNTSNKTRSNLMARRKQTEYVPNRAKGQTFGEDDRSHLNAVKNYRYSETVIGEDEKEGAVRDGLPKSHKNLKDNHQDYMNTSYFQPPRFSSYYQYASSGKGRSIDRKNKAMSVMSAYQDVSIDQPKLLENDDYLVYSTAGGATVSEAKLASNRYRKTTANSNSVTGNNSFRDISAMNIESGLVNMDRPMTNENLS